MSMSVGELWRRCVKSELAILLPNEMLLSGLLEGVLLQYCASPVIRCRKRKICESEERAEDLEIIDLDNNNTECIPGWECCLIYWSTSEGRYQTTLLARFQGLRTRTQVAKWLLTNDIRAIDLWRNIEQRYDEYKEGIITDHEFRVDHCDTNRLIPDALRLLGAHRNPCRDFLRNPRFSSLSQQVFRDHVENLREKKLPIPLPPFEEQIKNIGLWWDTYLDRLQKNGFMLATCSSGDGHPSLPRCLPWPQIDGGTTYCADEPWPRHRDVLAPFIISFQPPDEINQTIPAQPHSMSSTVCLFTTSTSPTPAVTLGFCTTSATIL
jgi:hypothetical protein